jgi:hypothetical protein
MNCAPEHFGQAVSAFTGRAGRRYIFESHGRESQPGHQSTQKRLTVFESKNVLDYRPIEQEVIDGAGTPSFEHAWYQLRGVLEIAVEGDHGCPLCGLETRE